MTDNDRRLESRMPRKWHVRFGGGPTEKDPQGHLAGSLPYGEPDDPDEAGDRFWIADFDGDDDVFEEFEATEAEAITDDALGRAKSVFGEVADCPETYVDRWVENHDDEVPMRFLAP
jgi:hypothetical protein